MDIKGTYKSLLERFTPFVSSVIYWLLKLTAWTMRFERVNFDFYHRRLKEGANSIFAFWHGRLAMMPFAYSGRGVVILVSQHRDGELISRVVERFGIESVRGSSTRGWLGGMKGLLRAIREGKDVAITPDGPRGPCMKVQMGVLQVARKTGLPIIPVAFSASKKKSLKPGIVS